MVLISALRSSTSLGRFRSPLSDLVSLMRELIWEHSRGFLCSLYVA